MVYSGSLRRKAIIYMNPNIGKEYIAEIKTAFGIATEPEIRYDFSEHYKCFLDKDSRRIRIFLP